MTRTTANGIFPAKPQPAQARIAPYWLVPDRWQGSLTNGPINGDQRIHRPDLWDPGILPTSVPVSSVGWIMDAVSTGRQAIKSPHLHSSLFLFASFIFPGSLSIHSFFVPSRSPS